jgi:hypothetical protein
MTSRFLAPIVLLLLLLITGCASTQSHRIAQYKGAFRELPAATQERIRSGKIQEGDSPLVVYLSLGPPNRSPHFQLPKVRDGDEWRYLGKPGEGGAFRTTYSSPFFSGRALQILTIRFDAAGVEAIHLSSPRDTDNGGS